MIKKTKHNNNTTQRNHFSFGLRGVGMIPFLSFHQGFGDWDLTIESLFIEKNVFECGKERVQRNEKKHAQHNVFQEKESDSI